MTDLCRQIEYYDVVTPLMSPAESEQDYYDILGARETASQEEIERLYKLLAKRHHPDRGGDPERMKAINEAYRVLGNASTRHTYDSQHAYDSRTPPGDDAMRSVKPPLSRPSAALRQTISGQLVGALFFLLAGLLFLFLVRIYYIRFMWPLLLIAAFVAFVGVWKVHSVMVFARQRVAPSDPVLRNVWMQEVAFWSIVSGGAYGLYLLLKAI